MKHILSVPTPIGNLWLQGEAGALGLLAGLVEVVLPYLSAPLAAPGLAGGGGAGGQPPRPVVRL